MRPLNWKYYWKPRLIAECRTWKAHADYAVLQYFRETSSKLVHSEDVLFHWCFYSIFKKLATLQNCFISDIFKISDLAKKKDAKKTNFEGVVYEQEVLPRCIALKWDMSETPHYKKEKLTLLPVRGAEEGAAAAFPVRKKKQSVNREVS